MSSYGQLGADFYDAEKPLAEVTEVDWYADQITAARGPALEAMCGSGRLLIPLLRRGCLVEGVDNAPAMLANLEKRSRSFGLRPPVIYQQSVTELALGKKYRIILVALGSFQLLPDDAAKVALARFRDHIEDGGRLVLDTFVPWDLIEMPDGERHAKRMQPSGKTMIHLDTVTTVDVANQRYFVRNRYERREGNTLLESEDEEFSVRWYFPDELLPLISAAGFEAQSLGIPFMADRPRRHLYTAILR